MDVGCGVSVALAVGVAGEMAAGVAGASVAGIGVNAGVAWPAGSVGAQPLSIDIDTTRTRPISRERYPRCTASLRVNFVQLRMVTLRIIYGIGGAAKSPHHLAGIE